MELNSGRKIVHRILDLIPMPDAVIACVNTLGSDQTKIITFTDRHGRVIGDVETPGVGDNSDKGEVGFPGVDAELEEEDMEITDMDTERNVAIPGVDMEGQEPPPPPPKLLRPTIPTSHKIQV